LNAIDPLDAVILCIGMAAGSRDMSSTPAAFRSADQIWISGVPAGGAELTLPAITGLKPILTDSDNAGTVTLRRGDTTIDLAPGKAIDAVLDASANGLAGTPEDDASTFLPGLDLSGVVAVVRSISLGDGDQSVSAQALAQFQILRLTGADGSSGQGDTLTLAARAWSGVVASECTVNVSVSCNGGDPIVLEPGDIVSLLSDGQGGIVAPALGSIEGGGGDGGSGLEPWQVVTAADSPFQAAAGDRLAVDTTDGAVTVRLWSTPAEFDQLDWIDRKQTFGTHALTIDRNGSTIMNAAQDMTVSTSGLDGTLRHNGTTFAIPGVILP
jgi:hypothetical protein